MLAWYEDIKNLTEKTGEDRNAFVRRHARSLSSASQKPGSVSSDGAMDEDEADETPYAAEGAMASNHAQPPAVETQWQRPQPGGRFPSDVQLNRHLHVPMSPSSAESSGERDALAAAGGLPGSGVPFSQPQQSVPGGAPHGWVSNGQTRSEISSSSPTQPMDKHEHQHVEWMAPVASSSMNGAASRYRNSYDPYVHQPPQSQQIPPSQHYQTYDSPYESAAHKYDTQHQPPSSRGGSAPIPLAPEAAPAAEVAEPKGPVAAVLPSATVSADSTRPESNSSTNRTNQSVADSGTGLENTITTDTSIHEGSGVEAAVPLPASTASTSDAVNGTIHPEKDPTATNGSPPDITTGPVIPETEHRSGTESTSPNPDSGTSATTISDLRVPGKFPS